MEVDLPRARTLLAERFGADPDTVALIGEGAWSRCFAFDRGDEALVARFGRYRDDFVCDTRAHAYAGPDLPIPEVLAIDDAFGGHVAVSVRVEGAPLESLDAAGWAAVVPSLAAALEAMRLADVSATRGVGGWDEAGHGTHLRWTEHLLAVADDPPEARTHGWSARLAARPEAADAFGWGYQRLREVASDDVPRSLIHADLINRNALVRGGRLAGIFDWGCARFGDHLYDLAWFEFWSPWHPELDVALLRTALAARWRAAGYEPVDLERRLLACHLHIGLDHLAYNAHSGDEANLLATARRMRALASPQ